MKAATTLNLEATPAHVVQSLETQPHARPSPRTYGASEFFQEFFSRLEQRGIQYAILHGYDDFPTHFDSDVDYVVHDADLPSAAQILGQLARARGWVVAQVCEHELFARYTVVIDPENPAHHLAFDVCSHFAKKRCLLLRDTVLLKDRQHHPRGFFTTAPAAEFLYLLAKSVRAHARLERYLPRLRELASLDPIGTQRAFDEFFSGTGQSLDDWLRGPGCDFQQFEAAVVRRTRYGWRLRLVEVMRRARRAAHPVGLHIALLGPDGSGKSTLIANLECALAPCFSRQRVFRFRPDIFNQIGTRAQPTPHLRPPRSRAVSCAKALFYFADWWAGLFLRLLPERRRGALMVFDRDFNDLFVDQRRYLVQGVRPLVEVLRRLVPRADATFILDCAPEAVSARKAELPLVELQRQREAFRRVAASSSRMHLVSADQSAEEVWHQVTREIILHLGNREQRRKIPCSKRFFDLVAAVAALVVLSPVLAVLAFLVRVKLGTPVLFQQARPGLLGRPFTIWKFRTMTDTRNAADRLLPDAERVTPFGQFMRSTSLDELPELFNVVRGEMSLVGPRPLLVDYLPLYSDEQKRRHEVLPGITGLAQINGRNAASWRRRFELDVWYVDHQSLWLDLKIIGLTILKVLKREGINQPGGISSDRFRGDAPDGPMGRKQVA